MGRSKFFYCLIISSFCIFCSSDALGQQDPQFSLYNLNYLYYNPAYSGIEGVTKITAVHRSQWLGYDGTFEGRGDAPSTQVVSFTTPLFRFRSGVGAFFSRDDIGPLNNIEFNVSYAYHLALKNSKVSFGVRAGIYSQSINTPEYRAIIDPEFDPVLSPITNGSDAQIRPDLAVGIYYQAEKYYVGISANHLTQSEFDFGVSPLKNPLESHGYFTAGYNYNFNYRIVLTPSILVRTDFNQYNFDIGVSGVYDERIMGGISFRQGEAAILMVGYNLTKDKALGINYAFDFVFVEQEAKSPTSHEFVVSYRLPVTVSGGKKVIRTPRFRH
ncbi:MAG: type IX secretion system membrane protein PorP/SprF [Bacteroidota bacterium]